MKLWIVYSEKVLQTGKNNALSWMLDEAKACGFDAKIYFAERFSIALDNGFKFYYDQTLLEPPTCVLTRCYDIPLLQHFEDAGIKVYNNSNSLRDCLDKWRTHQLLVKNKIPTPKSLFAEQPLTYEFVVEQLGTPFILKDNYGAKGEQVFLIEDESSYDYYIKCCETPLYQAYVKASYGRDVRLHVIGESVVASVLRTSNSDFKSNFSQGGSADFFELDEEIKALAIASTKALNLDFSGIDVLFTAEGYTVCEVNGVPGFRTVGLTSKYNIPYAMMDYIRRQR